MPDFFFDSRNIFFWLPKNVIFVSFLTNIMMIFLLVLSNINGFLLFSFLIIIIIAIAKKIKSNQRWKSTTTTMTKKMDIKTNNKNRYRFFFVNITYMIIIINNFITHTHTHTNSFHYIYYFCEYLQKTEYSWKQSSVVYVISLFFSLRHKIKSWPFNIVVVVAKPTFLWILKDFFCIFEKILNL